MGGMGGHGQVAPGELVLALGAGLNAGETMIDRPFDCLIIAKLEVQERHLFGAPPIAPIECVRPDEVEGARDRLRSAVGKKQ